MLRQSRNPDSSGKRAIVIISILFASAVSHAAITWSGDVDPADPSTWDSSTDGYIGKSGDGTMGITGGSNVIDSHGYIGDESGSTGEVTVDGSGSTWTNGRNLVVGNGGNGTLNITNGGKVSSSWGLIGYESGSMGVVNVDGANSTWTNSFGLAVGNGGNGTLNITDGGKGQPYV